MTAAKKRARTHYTRDYKRAIAERANIEGASSVASTEKLDAGMVRRWARQFNRRRTPAAVEVVTDDKHRRITDADPAAMAERIAHLERVNATLAKAVAELAAE